MRGKGRGGDPKGWFTPHVRNPEKYSDCRTYRISGGGNTRHLPRAANTFAPPLFYLFYFLSMTAVSAVKALLSCRCVLCFEKLVFCCLCGWQMTD